MSMDMPNTTSAPPVGRIQVKPGAAEIPPALRELLELERRQLVARLKLVERLLGVAPARE